MKEAALAQMADEIKEKLRKVDASFNDWEQSYLIEDFAVIKKKHEKNLDVFIKQLTEFAEKENAANAFLEDIQGHLALCDQMEDLEQKNEKKQPNSVDVVDLEQQPAEIAAKPNKGARKKS